MHAAILRCEPDVVARARAAWALANDASRVARSALVSALENERFWGVSREIAKALGTKTEPWAKEALLATTAHAHPKVRRAVARALSTFRDDPTVVTALSSLRNDHSYFVVAEALTSLGKVRAREAFEILTTALGEKSWHDTIASGAAFGLGESADERAVAPLVAATQLDPHTGLARRGDRGARTVAQIARRTTSCNRRAYRRCLRRPPRCPCAWPRCELQLPLRIARFCPRSARYGRVTATGAYIARHTRRSSGSNGASGFRRKSQSCGTSWSAYEPKPPRREPV